jgi:2-amino-4-hydroxy-6-hydroxymethyldihydropteridine diphosphokinase
MVRAAIALGSNLGDRQAALQDAVGQLAGRLDGLAVSAFIDTEPEGVGAQPRFLNAAAVGGWDGGARPLLDLLMAIEKAAGRDRPYPGAPRTLDLDLILLGPAVVDEPGLVVPHPRFRERGFVLAPLCQIAPDLVDPVTGCTVAQLYRSWLVKG